MKRWPHAPSHLVTGPGLYMVTGAKFRKETLFNTDAKLDLLEDALLSVSEVQGWLIQAWAVFANHYHFVGIAPEDGGSLSNLVKALHGSTAVALNRMDGLTGRRVWFNYWDTKLTFERSYLARLAYVHNNPVRHGLAVSAELYPWCSADWFRQRADRSFYETVMSFRTDRVNVLDDFQTPRRGPEKRR